MIRVFLLLVAAVTALATAQTIAPANFTSSTADLKAEDGLMLWLTEGPYWVPIAAVLPLTTAAKTIPKTVDLSGTVRVLTASSDIVPKPDDICVISCDSSPGYFSPLETFNQAQTANVSAVLFYTIQADYCNLEGYAGSYPWIYSMKSQNNTATLLNVANTPDPDNDGAVGAAIEYSDQTPESAGAGNSSTGPLGPSPTTAVAMIILYSVTGVITILFLVIILSGAIRAHRHPERYGPRNAVGGPRQSRAKGLARAMLDTLPIVKFSQRNTPKPTDIELAENVGAAPSTTETTEMPASQTPARDPRAEAQEDNATRRSMEGGIAAATNLEQSQSGDNLGCSICTEDFEDGQDQRVLPCDHRFHPECVDPWLLNVSGTCPLCRIDLRPASSTSDTMPLDDNGEPILGNGSDAPPLGLQGTAGERQRMTIRRSIMIGIMGVGRLEVLSQEERLYALRRLRRQRLVLQRREEQAAVAETPEEESRARRMLRGFARRRTTVASSNAAPEQPSSEIASVANGHGQG